MKTEHKIAQLCRMYGTRQSDGSYQMGTSGADIEIDGRFTEEYEDIDSPCPVKMDWIAVGSGDLDLYMHVHSNFPTNYPLASNDKYCFDIIGAANIKKVHNYLLLATATMKVNAEASAELRRAAWLDIANRVQISVTLKKKTATEKRESCDIMHAIDCRYACHDAKDETDYRTDAQFRKAILDTITTKAAFALRCKYPDYKAWKSSGYLAMQTTQRYERYLQVVPYAWEKIEKLMPQARFDEILTHEPTSKNLTTLCKTS